MDTFEDETVDGIKEDIDTLKEEVKKNVTIPSDLNEKWSEIKNNVTGLMQDFDAVNNFTKELDDNLYYKGNDIEQLQEDRDEIKKDIGEIKDNWEYFEGTTFLSFREEMSSQYNEFIQLQQDVNKLKNDFKKGPSLPFPLNANSDLSTQMTFEECMQTIYFLFSSIHFGEHPIDFGLFIDECQNPDGQGGEEWSGLIEQLRSAKTNW
jgi:hypothetical protein